MSQSDYIKDIARYGLENDQAKLLDVLEQLIEHSRKMKKVNFALQLQSILKESLRTQKNSVLSSVGSELHRQRLEDRDLGEFILEKITSDYTFDNLICSKNVIEELSFFIEEHKSIRLLQEFDLPVSNKVLFHGPSGCGKTLASYVLAGELHKLMYVVNLGAIVSSRLGETSKNLAKIFRRASVENCVIFIDEFDSLGKVRDYSQDHGEMKRIVNTILQLLDFLPQECIVIAATNQLEMIDDALIRRFDVNIKFELPTMEQIRSLVDLTLRNGKFKFDPSKSVDILIKKCVGLSYYSIQKTLITAIKRSIFEAASSPKQAIGVINTTLWANLIELEKKAQLKSKPPRKKGDLK